MNKLLFLLLVGISFYGCEKDFMQEEPQEPHLATRAMTVSSELYYWLGEEKIPLEKVDGKTFVMFDSANEKAFNEELSKVGIKLDNVEIVSGYLSKKDAGSESVEYKTATIEGEYEKIAPALYHVFYSAPYYMTSIGGGCLTNQFSILLKGADDFGKLEKLAKEHTVEILGVSESDGWYELACTNFSTGNALEMANLFYETGQFESVSYDLGARGCLDYINEPLYANGGLWHLGNNSTNSDIHINHNYATMMVPQVPSSVKIAIIDAGVQYNHPDLHNVLPGWDAESQSAPNVVSHNHGTQVAGFIGAIPNNGQAVAGVACGATILPISFVVDASSGRILSSAKVMARAIDRAVSEGARIINCSWEYSDNRVVAAVKRALDSDCIVVFASGNNSSSVSSPANSDSRIIVVGAIKENGTRRSSSNIGTALDVVAPGENLASTDFGSGYAVINGISGTSMAAPIVSGIAALVLSIAPHFSSFWVEQMIAQGARELQGYTYTPYLLEHRSLPWNSETGWGLLDAYDAVTETFKYMAQVTGSSSADLNTSYWPYAFNNGPTPLPAGVTFTHWAVYGGPYQVLGSLTDFPTVNVKFTSLAQYVVEANFIMPDGSTFTRSKEIDLRPLIEAPDLILEYSTGNVPGYDAKFTITNYDPNLTYEWEAIGDVEQIIGPSIWVQIPDTPPADVWHIGARCKVFDPRSGSYLTSQWRYVIVDYSGYI